MTKTEARKLFGTWTALAEACGITPSAVSQWPEELSRRETQRVIGAAVQRGLWHAKDALEDKNA